MPRRNMSGAYSPEQFDAAMSAKTAADLDDAMRVLMWLVKETGKTSSSLQVNVALERMELALASKSTP